VQHSSSPWRVFDAPSGQGSMPGQGSGAGLAPAQGGLAGQPIAIAAIGAAILIGALAIVVAMSGAGAPLASGPEETLGGATAPAAAGGEIVVDVAGAVVTPGVYRLVSGTRVSDAIDAAGGFSPRVDADRVAVELNLASVLADGQQVRVPSRDDDPGSAGGGTSAGGAGAGGGGAASGSGATRIDLNTATQAELESLPGIGPVTAGKIIESRAEAPFKTIDELRERGLVGEKTFESLRTLVTVG
jgi:competence protein ComEA